MASIQHLFQQIETFQADIGHKNFDQFQAGLYRQGKVDMHVRRILSSSDSLRKVCKPAHCCKWQVGNHVSTAM
jgi:hypothetical protein